MLINAVSVRIKMAAVYKTKQIVSKKKLNVEQDLKQES